MMTQQQQTRFESAAALEAFLAASPDAAQFVDWTQNAVILRENIPAPEPAAKKPVPRVKMLGKETAQLMEPLLDGSWRPTTVQKHFFKCLDCGLVWQTKTEADICATSGHVPVHVRQYGGYFENGIRRGHATFEIPAVRLEDVE